MTKQTKVYLNKGTTRRVEVAVDVLRESATTLRVRLPDGNVIKRKKRRDLVVEEGAHDVALSGVTT